MKVSDFSIKTGCVGGKNTLVKDIFKSWIKEKTNIFIITDDTGKKVIGVLTLYDILKKIIPFYLKLDEILVNLLDNTFLEPAEVKEVLNKTAEEFMTTKVRTVKESDPLIRAAVIMYHQNFDYLPVVDKNGEFKNKIVTRNSIEEALLKFSLDQK